MGGEVLKRYLLIPFAIACFICIVFIVHHALVATTVPNGELKRTVVDATGTSVSIPVNPKRVIILNSANVDMYYAVGGTVVGKPISSYYAPELRQKIKDIPSIGTIHSPNVEAILGLKPDLVIGVNLPYNTSIREQLAVAGIPLYINNLNSFEDMEATLRFFGQLTGHEDVANVAISNVKTRYNELRSKADVHRGPRTLIIFGSPGSFSMATSTSFSGNLLSLLQGRNIADFDSSLDGAYVPLSLEYVNRMNPEVIFFISMSPKSDSVDVFKRELATDKAWQQIQAVQTGRIYYLSGGLFGVNPGMRSIEAMNEMYEDLYGKGASL